MFKKGSFIIWLFISCYFIYSTFELSPWKQKKIIDQDVIYYYGYLPATFIYHDWSFSFTGKPGLPEKEWSILLPNGKRIQKMTMGVAMLYSPFFGIAHFYTKLTGGIANGYSINYHVALIWAGVFYFILGLYFLRKIMVQFFPDLTVSIVLIALSLGTNLFVYASWEGALSHVYSFFLFALALWVFLKWIADPKIWLTILLGIALGLIVLVRPTNVTFVLFIGLYFFFRDKSFSNKWQFILELKWKLLLITGAALLIWIPQMIYWKLNSGQFLLYSYQGEKFYFNNPQIFNGLLSFNKGWLIYTPLMWLAVIGFLLMRDKLKEWLWPTFITMIVSIYIIFSWWCWWYGGGFSARALVEFYVVMSFPLGAFFTYILKKKLIYKAITSVVLVLIIWLNLFQARQYRSSLLHWDSMSKQAYWAIWGKQSWPDNYEKLLIHLDADKAKRGEDAYP